MLRPCHHFQVGASVLLAFWTLMGVTFAEEPGVRGLKLRRGTESSPSMEERPIPREAVRVYVYEGQPRSVRLTATHIAVDFGRSGVLFDRVSGTVARRLTAGDGWPRNRPPEFAPESRPWRHERLVGPGVLNPYGVPDPGPSGTSEGPSHQTVAEVQFDGHTWRALQPLAFLRTIERPRLDRWVTWNDILARLNERCMVEADPGFDRPRKWFTSAQGLASNIVTRLAVHDNSLYAACVDIYDPRTKAWSLGGLCRYDRARGRWQRIEVIDGRPVRWVTLLEAMGDELWVGFREGEGVAGEKVAFGMGIYPGIYRPRARNLVLARMAQGRWTTFTRPPRPEGPPRFSSPETPAEPSTEFPSMLARLEDQVVLFSRVDARHLSGSWDVPLAGQVSLLKLSTGIWKTFDLARDLQADLLLDMMADPHEVLLSSNRGILRFDQQSGTWCFLDPTCDLKNSEITTAAPVGDELWLGYGRQSFGVWGGQGISRFHERTGRWSYLDLGKLKTAAPVRRIVPLPDGDVWILFGQRPFLGAAIPFTYYPREEIPRPTGLGRFRRGTWEFPVPGPSEYSSTPPLFGSGDDLIALGSELVYCTRSEVFTGPSPWRRLVEGSVLHIGPTNDGKGVEILRPMKRPSSEGQTRYERAVYNGQDRNLLFREIKDSSFDVYRLLSGNDLLPPHQPVLGEWVPLPGDTAAKWLVGPFGGQDVGKHSVLETPSAFWIFSEGEVVRLDREILLKKKMNPF